MNSFGKNLVAFCIAVAALVVTQQEIEAQGYVFAITQDNPDLIMHANGYDGSGGTLTVTVGIDPTSVNAVNMTTSVMNVVSVWNGLQATTSNLQTGIILPAEIDFESVLLHEMGHALGLAHVNLAGESGTTGADTNYSKSNLGTNGSLDLNSGTDGIIGSADDLRGDDINFNFFESGVNNPFSVNAIVDSTTYTNDIAFLPGGDTYVANADRDVASTFGLSDTESVMQQGSFFGETQRTLAASDVIGIRYAESGLDELQGTADDYDLVLEFVGLDVGADIVIDFDNAQTGFAVTQNSFSSLGSDHWRINNAQIYFNDTYNWSFNSTLAVPEPGSLTLVALVGFAALLRRQRRG